MTAQRRSVQITDRGPMLVEGPVCIEMPDGSKVESDRFMVAVCTCRRSKTYPLCDTSHRKHVRADRADKNHKATKRSA